MVPLEKIESEIPENHDKDHHILHILSTWRGIGFKDWIWSFRLEGLRAGLGISSSFFIDFLPGVSLGWKGRHCGDISCSISFSAG